MRDIFLLPVLALVGLVACTTGKPESKPVMAELKPVVTELRRPATRTGMTREWIESQPVFIGGKVELTEPDGRGFILDMNVP